MMQETQEREKTFHNKIFKEGTRRSVHKFYEIARQDEQFYKDFLRGNAPNRSILEYGCGTGSLVEWLLPYKPLKVTGIDISDVAIGMANKKYQVQVCKGQLSFHVMDAENLSFGDETFDIVCGKSILHHLNLEKCYKQIARVLKRDGRAIFLEPLGHNPMLNLYRKLTPKLRSVDEHPLLESDLELCKSYFGNVESHFFRLTSIFALPFRRLSIFPFALRFFDKLDRVLFSTLPFLRKHAWIVIMIVSNPKR